ncbi:alpha/beta hydrolase [Streptomyces sp. OE57]|uniref:alpha/beta hydrolase n=1 Tax=Streptomyces lacaronensis TaxID=3379885 RepID=UPI0039B7439C
MTQAQRQAVVEAVRDAPIDLGGELEALRLEFEALLASRPIPADVVAVPIELGPVSGLRISTGSTVAGRTVLFVHGGGFVVGSAIGAVGLASAVGGAAGTESIAVDYRLAPEYPFPAGLDDVVAAYAALIDSGTPASSIAIAGESAGGNLVLATLVALRDRGLPLPACTVVMSPFVDLTLETSSRSGRAQLDPALSTSALRQRISEYLGDTDPHHPLASPLLANLRGLPPLLVQVGSYEVLLDDALELARKAAHADVDVALEVTAGVPHVFQTRAAVLDEAREAIESVGRFIDRHTQRQ